MSVAAIDPVAAATAPDPYGFYAHLVAERPLYFERGLQLWVAASAVAVSDVLGHPCCHVRPADERVPKPLAGSAAGEIFGSLVRMADGDYHHSLKRGIERAFEGLPLPALETSAAARARELSHAEVALQDSRSVTRFAFRFPVYTIATLLGISEHGLPEVADAVEAFSAGIAPGAADEQRTRGSAAATSLRAVFAPLAAAIAGSGRETLFHMFRREACVNGIPDDRIVANAIGLLFQTCDATAGLIGNTIVTLGRRQDLLDRARHQPQELRAIVEEVARFDPPVQNTRRFVVSPGLVAGQPMQAGDVILVLLAAANRDPDANADPGRFDLHRPNRRTFTFGAGSHACPGSAFAVAIAASGVQHLLEEGVDPPAIATRFSYRPSVNLRIPIFE